MQIKICGITRFQDLKTCEKYNTNFIGFINIKRSRRFVGIEKINELREKMNDPQKAVLVLEPQNVDEVIEKASLCGIENVQLHSLQADEIARINNINVIKVIGISNIIDDSKINEIKDSAKVCKYLLFDFEVSGQSGGTGKQIPLEVALNAALVARNANPRIKLFLAGGMDAKRIRKEGKNIKKIFDYVDVNSGVEDSPGVKNKSKINEFMKTCSQVN